jgi:hypothetical protein
MCLPSRCPETVLVYQPISRSLLSNSSTRYIAPSLRLFVPNGLQANCHFSFPRAVTPTSVLGVTFLPVAQFSACSCCYLHLRSKYCPQILVLRTLSLCGLMIRGENSHLHKIFVLNKITRKFWFSWFIIVTHATSPTFPNLTRFSIYLHTDLRIY